MFPSISVIKENARIILREKWGRSAAVTVIFFMCVILELTLKEILMMLFKLQSLWAPLSNQAFTPYVALTSLATSVFSCSYFVFITFPLFAGVLKWFWHLSENDDRAISEIFHFFSNLKEYLRCVRIIALLIFKMAIVVVLAFLPFTLIQIITDPNIYNSLNLSMPIFISSLRALSGISIFIGVAISFILSFLYLGFFIPLITMPSLSARQTVKMGKDITKGLRENFLLLIIHFIPLFVICIFVLPLLIVFPYFLTTLVCLGRYIVFYKKSSQI